MKRVAVVGAGAAGLCAAKHLAAAGIPDISFVVYEQTEHIGGTWVYTEKTHTDDYGLPIHSSMYKNLRTNLPKETMEFTSFPFKHEKSFLSRTDVLQYLNDYAHEYNLKKYIKFLHHVLSITPINDLWEVTVKNLRTHDIDVSSFNAVIICNGHYSEPRLPYINGMNSFKRIQMHSHDYRDPEHFIEKKVVVIGSGPSGVDISFDLAPYAKTVFFSHHSPSLKNKGFPDNVIHKPDITSIMENDVIFTDGTNETVDAIIYCTGYKYSFPFLSEKCGITVEDNFVKPLYKHLVNINNPSMWFIGIPWQSLMFPMFDLQVQCFLSVLFKKTELPSTIEMLTSLRNEVEERERIGVLPRYHHKLGDSVRNYLVDLANSFNVEPIPEVVHRIYDSARIRRGETLSGYREDVYQIIDSYNYILNGNKNK